jgi:glycosyltransferase involved in cell wall biosynthesis
VATLEPRKNLKRIIEAFNLLKEKDLKLVIVGKSGWGQEINKLNLNEKANIIFTGFADREDLSSLYSGAKCFVFPSLYEGFGLPILEAMKCGCPVVTSNLSSMPEVAGEAGILIDPLDTKKIAGGINQVISDKATTESLRKKGFEQVKKFSWEKTAEQTLKIYQQAFQQ